MRNPDLYRPSVGMMIMNSDGMIFMAKKTGNIGTDVDCWQMPQGGIENGEKEEDALARELFEETGVNIKDVKIVAKTGPDWIFYDIPQDKAKEVWNGRYIGQKQKWFLLKASKELKINLNPKNEEKPEFYTYTWANPNQVTEFSIWFRKDVYTAVLKSFEKHLS